MSLKLQYQIKGGDFSEAGQISSKVKKALTEKGIDAHKIKNIVIGLYEAEVNVVAHAFSGWVNVEIDDDRIIIVVEDKGPGIEDINQAMKQGFSTASNQVIEMGFGAGLGLSNMEKNTDELNITSKPGEWTKVVLINYFETKD